MHVSFKSGDETLQAMLYGNSSVGVILCPPHPLYGGSRNDTRLVRVAKELFSNGISALCVDYGSYSKGVKEVQNILDSVSFMQKKVYSIGLLGYSFGAVVASNAAAQAEVSCFVSMSILRNVNGLKAVLDFDCPKLFVHGKRDIVTPYSDFEKLYNEAKERKEKLVLDTDHYYMDNYPKTIQLASRTICRFFEKVFSKLQVRR